MTTFEQAFDATTAIPQARETPRRKTRALRLSVVPSFHTLVQVGCAGAALYGVHMKWGTAITLIAAGVLGAVVSMLREGGKI